MTYFVAYVDKLPKTTQTEGRYISLERIYWPGNITGLLDTRWNMGGDVLIFPADRYHEIRHLLRSKAIPVKPKQHITTKSLKISRIRKILKSLENNAD